MARVAQIKISADVASLKQSVAQAKQTIESLNNIKLNPKSMDAIKDAFGKELDDAIEKTKKKLGEVQDKLDNLNSSGVPKLGKDFAEAAEDAKDLKGQIDDLIKAKKKLSSGEVDLGKGPGLMKKLQGGAMSAAGTIGLGLGVAATYNHAQEMAKQRVRIRSLTGGNGVDENSPYAFTTDERRERASGIAQSIGRNMSTKELSNLTSLSEGSERAFGLEGGTFNAAATEGRKAGVDSEQKMLMQSMGTAVANGLEGSRIGEYLSSMTGFMAEMSDSITVSPESINGFASAFGDIPFFKNDPSRLFGQMRGINGAFQNGDRFQQAQSARAILRSNSGATPAEIELRRSLGLFGNSKDLVNRFSKMEGGKGLAKTLSVSGSDIMNNMFGESRGATKGMKMGERVQSIMTRLGLQGEGGMNVAADIIEGKNVSTDKIVKGQMSPEEQLKTRISENSAKSLAGMEGGMLDLAKDVSRIKDSLGENLGQVITKIALALDKIAEFFGISDGAKATATAVTAGAGAYAVNKLSGGAAKKGVEKLASKAATSAVAKKMASSAATKFGMKAIPYVGEAIMALESEDLGRGSDMVDESEYARGEYARGGQTSNANIPFATGLGKTEEQAARGFNPVNVAGGNPSGMSLPDILKTTDSEAVGYLKQIAEAMTGRGPSPMRDRVPSNVQMFSGGKVGK